MFADTPDIDKTARQVAAAITGNAGQVCVSGSRLLVESTIAPVLIEKVINHFRQLTPGSTWQKAPPLLIISQKQADQHPCHCPAKHRCWRNVFNRRHLIQCRQRHGQRSLLYPNPLKNRNNGKSSGDRRDFWSGPDGANL
ncbi:aldehyde dehydrogenase family protein [Vibrio sp. PP-XX7]